VSPTQRSAAVYADFLLPHLTDRTDLVDVGCGDGELTLDLAAAVRSVVGVDADEDEVTAGRARAARDGVPHATFETGDAYALGLADACADAVLAHSVLEALAHPLSALAEMRRILRAGGVVGVASVEYGGLILGGPHADLLRRFYDIREQLWLRDGADPYLGRHLRGLLAESGFTEVVATTKAMSYGTPELVSAFGRGRAEDCADDWYVASATEAELATPAGLEAMRDAWLEWAESTSAYCSFAWCRALGWKR
jgi:ubiquinone/menaquinone biosynthesis C-methylase UbiE